MYVIRILLQTTKVKFDLEMWPLIKGYGTAISFDLCVKERKLKGQTVERMKRSMQDTVLMNERVSHG